MCNHIVKNFVQNKKTLPVNVSRYDTAVSNLQVVLQNLLMCMVCFYSLYYMVVSLCIGLLR